MKNLGELIVNIITIMLVGWSFAVGLMIAAKMFGLI